MRNRIVGVIVTGAFLVAGAALAQTPGPSLGPSIVPVTGPSTAPRLPEPPKPDAGLAPMPTPSGKGGVDTAIGMPAAKATVKKAPAPKRVAKAAAPPVKTKHAATAKRRTPTRQATVGPPMPVAKRPPPAKDPVTSKPVLPRV